MKQYRTFSGTLAALNHYAEDGWSMCHVESYKIDHEMWTNNYQTEEEYNSNPSGYHRCAVPRFTLITGLMVRDQEEIK